MSSITAFLADLADRHGSRPAIITDRETVSFAGFAQRVRRAAEGLRALGVGAGDRVVIWLPNVPAWLEAACACARLGAIAVACNTRFRSTEVGDIVSRSRAKALLLWPDFKHIPFLGILGEVPAEQLANLETIVLYRPGGDAAQGGGRDAAAQAGPAAAVFQGRKVVDYAALAGGNGDGNVDGNVDGSGNAAGNAGNGRAPAGRSADPLADVPDPSDDTGFLCFLTSGTTSRPKFPLHSQAAIVQHAHDVADAQGYRQPGVRVLTMNPLCGVLGFNQALAALAAGAPQVLPTHFDAAAIAELIPRERITHALGIDEAFLRIFDRVPAQRPFPTLRLIGSGSYNGDFAAFVQSADARGITTVGIYGMSEIGAVYSCQRADAEPARRAVAGGYPVSADGRVRARDPETGRLLPHGEAGELEFAGPSRMIGYLDDPAATAKALTEDGYVRSGDIGCTHEDGSYSFISRMGDALRLSGFLVSPLEIAGVLEAHESVARCQVVGCMVGVSQRAVAFVVPARPGGLDEAALIDWCKQRLAPFKAPVRVLAVDAFPVSTGPNGEKVQLGKLRDMAAAAVA